MEENDVDASNDRLAAIKAEGRRRRERRQRRNATFGGVAAAVLVIGIPLSLRLGGDGTDSEPFAARRGCVASTDPSCGPFHWEPVPKPNEPMKATFEQSTTVFQATAGRPLEIQIAWEDPDASTVDVVVACWGEEPCTAPPPPCVNDEATGTWVPPQSSPGSGSLRLAHTYLSQGSYELSLVLRSSSWDRVGCPPAPGDPYANETTLTATVQVR